MAYVERNRPQYTRAAIHSRLLKDGVAPGYIDLAMIMVYGDQPAGSASLYPDQPRASLTVIAAVLAANLFVLFAFLLVGAPAGWNRLVLLGGLGIELGVALLLKATGHDELGDGALYGIVWSVVVGGPLLLLLYGICSTGLRMR